MAGGRGWRRQLLCACLLLLAAPLLTAGQDEEGAVGKGFECPMEVTVPWTYEEQVKVDLSESVKFDDIANPLALSTVCTCPLASEGEMSTVCTCQGPKEDDCDAYARMMAFVMLTAEKFFGVFMHMGELEQTYHIENVAFWIVLGATLGWVGFFLILYSEIKAVLVVRERDERERLLNGKFMRVIESKVQEISEKEEAMLMPRPYLTMMGSALLWLGLLAQLLPFCNILALVFPGLEFFRGMCWIFVLVVTLVVAAATVLLVVGLIWSCTRGWAALVLVSLGVLGEIMVFGGVLCIVLWLVLTAGVIYLYFKFLPDYFEENGGAQWTCLQDLGNWYQISPAPEDWMVAASQQGSSLANEGLGVVKAIPGGDSLVDSLAPSSSPRPPQRSPPPTSPGSGRV